MYASSFPTASKAEGDSPKGHRLKLMDLRLNSGSTHNQTLEGKKSAELEMLVRDSMGLLLCLFIRIQTRALRVVLLL